MYTLPRKYIHHKLMKETTRVRTWKDRLRCGRGEQTWLKAVHMSLYGTDPAESAEYTFSFALFRSLFLFHVHTHSNSLSPSVWLLCEKQFHSP